MKQSVQGSDGPSEHLYHLVQQEDTILRIHSEELPPDEYYDELKLVLAKKFAGADPALIEHVGALVAAFDTAAGFAVSFGVAKFQLATTKAKLGGEYGGREGRESNPQLVEALQKWPPIRNQKDLQSFLGTINYIRPFCGPAFTRTMYPLKPLLKITAVFPMTKEQHDAVQALKALARDVQVLHVPDEAAALEAARAWMEGAPPAGRPYEGGVDTSKIAMG